MKFESYRAEVCQIFDRSFDSTFELALFDWFDRLENRDEEQKLLALKALAVVSLVYWVSDARNSTLDDELVNLATPHFTGCFEKLAKDSDFLQAWHPTNQTKEQHLIWFGVLRSSIAPEVFGNWAAMLAALVSTFDESYPGFGDSSEFLNLVADLLERRELANERLTDPDRTAVAELRIELIRWASLPGANSPGAGLLTEILERIERVLAR